MIQQEKAQQLHQLHHGGKLLVSPNVWDVLGAKLLQHLEFPAIATASAAVAYANGYLDGENIPFDDVLTNLTKIAGATVLPVTADIESGYADNESQLAENIKKVIAAGVVGINIEDTGKTIKALYPVEVQCSRIRCIKKAADEMGIPLFINARTDVLMHPNDFSSPAAMQEEVLRRGIAYKEAGADCFFPIALRDQVAIEQVVNELQMPVNIITMPGIPDLKTLQQIGVARVSLGPSFLKIAIRAMQQLAVQLKNLDGLTDITQNEITSDYLKMLVTKTIH